MRHSQCLRQKNGDTAVGIELREDDVLKLPEDFSFITHAQSLG